MEVGLHSLGLTPPAIMAQVPHHMRIRGTLLVPNWIAFYLVIEPIVVFPGAYS